MKKRDDIYLSQVSERIRRVAKHLRGVSRTRFLKSDLHRAAVVRELEVIGQAARMVSDETQERFPQIPWRQIIGMRNRLIHEYFDVDYEIVWDVATGELLPRSIPGGTARWDIITFDPTRGRSRRHRRIPAASRGFESIVDETHRDGTNSTPGRFDGSSSVTLATREQRNLAR